MHMDILSVIMIAMISAKMIYKVLIEIKFDKQNIIFEFSQNP